MFEHIVYHRDFLEMIKEQWCVSGHIRIADGLTRIRLCDVRFTTVKADINLSEVTVSARTGDFNATSLAHVVNTSTVNKLVVQSWLDRAGAYRAILLCLYC